LRVFFNSDGRPDDARLVDIATARALHDQLMGSRPEGASHNADICQFCVADKATQAESAVPDPSRPQGGPDVSDTNPTAPNEHGGRDTNPMSDTISTETHEALVKTKVADAVAATEAALATKTTEAADEKARADKAEAALETANAEVARLNGELDTAQVTLRAAEDKAAKLEADLAAKDEASAKEKLATERASQVRNLKIFDDTYVDERASSWADMAEDDWSARLDEWAKIRPASTEPVQTTDAASAMSGTTGSLTKEPESGTDAAAATKSSPRRAVLGLA
jgi:hypothetical protein